MSRWGRIQKWLDDNVIFFIILIGTPAGWWILFCLMFGVEIVRTMLGFNIK